MAASRFAYPFTQALGLFGGTLVGSAGLYAMVSLKASLGFLVAGCALTRFVGKGRSNTGHGVSSLAGKVAIVTGGNAGIGKVSAQELAKLGCRVILACRSVERGNAAALDIVKALKLKDPDQVTCLQLDLSDFASIREFVANFRALGIPLNILLNNAGIMMCPFGKTKDGLERQFGTNHMGHFLLVKLLMDEICAGSARVVNLSSLAHLRAPKGIELEVVSDPATYDPMHAYGVSKLANILFTVELQKRLSGSGSGATAYAAHPGGVRTSLGRHLPKAAQVIAAGIGHIIMKSPLEGAQTSLFCCLHPNAVPGRYHFDCAPKPTSAAGADEAAATQLWELSEKIVADSEQQTQ